MRNTLLYFLLCVSAVATMAQDFQDLVLVRGGTFKNPKSQYYGKHIIVPDFYVGKFEVTQKQWVDVMDQNPSEFKGDNLPVDHVSWYDCIEYCNKRSLKEGLAPYYTVDKGTKDQNNTCEDDEFKWLVTINPDANGYRLPTGLEWEYAASGGQESKGHTYSGSDDPEAVAWFWVNCGDKRMTEFWSWTGLKANNCRTRPVGGKMPNELGLYDMSGNVREWTWAWIIVGESDDSEPKESDRGIYRSWRGGGWIGSEAACTISFRWGYQPCFKSSDQGFRVWRAK